jgi:hypothetical protein
MSPFPFEVIGSPENTPSTAVEDSTARTMISMMKGMKNYLKTLAAGVMSSASLPAGTELVGKVGIDQTTANANEVVNKAGTALMGKVGIDQCQ